MVLATPPGMLLTLLCACDRPPPEPVALEAPPEPVAPPLDPWSDVPVSIEADAEGAYWSPRPGDCIELQGPAPFRIEVGDAVAIGAWSGVQVVLQEFGHATTVTLGVDPGGALWRLEQDAPFWVAAYPRAPPLEFLPSAPIVAGEFESGPALSGFPVVSEILELGPFGAYDDCVQVDRELQENVDELWWFCRGVGPVQIERDGAILTATSCAPG